VARILLDLSNPAFQGDWFALEGNEALAVLSALKKLYKMEWEQLYRDRGLHWEAILSRKGPGGQRIYSLRITLRMRAVAFRQGDYLRLLSMHADHDGAYQ
jgi:hypothetical protein